MIGDVHYITVMRAGGRQCHKSSATINHSMANSGVCQKECLLSLPQISGYRILGRRKNVQKHGMENDRSHMDFSRYQTMQTQVLDSENKNSVF
jgi:hypothetical protein